MKLFHDKDFEYYISSQVNSKLTWGGVLTSIK